MAHRLDSWPAPPARIQRQARAREAARRIAELEAEGRHRDWHRTPLGELAAEMHYEPETVRDLLRAPLAARASQPTGAFRKRRKDAYWSLERCCEAVRWWKARYGEVPKIIDWSPSQLRQKTWSSAPERLERLEAKWVDSEGNERSFPRPDRYPVRQAIEIVRRELEQRDGGARPG